jgi:FemAB-related protein (PEP-CTERM system-associated)
MSSAPGSATNLPASESTAPTDAVRLREGTPADDAARDAFVLAHPRGTFFHLAGWRRCVEDTFEHDGRDLIAERGGRIAGVLPLMRVLTATGAPQLISMPYAVYGGALGETPQIEAALVELAAARAKSERSGRLELRSLEAPSLPAQVPFQPFELYSTFIQDLPADPAQVLADMPKKARAEARKAREKHGLELVEGTWYLNDLYRLFHENKRNLGSPGLPFLWFHRLTREFGERVTLHLVHRQREPLAVVMSFSFRDSLLAYYAGTAEGADRSYSASNFMYVALREWAVARQFRQFDFGRSRRDSGAYRFKEHQGFTPRPLEYRVHLVRDRRLPSFNPSNPRTAWLRASWSHLPVWVTTRLSDRLSRYLP